ncbi:MAG: SPASM domain-containing protein, partial [Acidobacteria bacterium]
AGLRSITVSVDGLEEAHDWLRGRRGSHARAMEAARTCARAAGLVSDVVTCVNQRTIGELGRIKTMLVEAGVKAWRVITIFPRGRAARHPELRLTASQFRELMDFIVSCRAEGALRTSYDCEGFLGPYERRVRDGFAYCRAGITIASVLADGGISACPTVRGDFVQGSIYRDSFLDVWNTRYAIMRNRQWTRTGVCTGCEVYRWCEGNGLHLRTEHSDGPMVCHWRLLHEQGTQEGPGDPSVR